MNNVATTPVSEAKRQKEGLVLLLLLRHIVFFFFGVRSPNIHSIKREESEIKIKTEGNVLSAAVHRQTSITYTPPEISLYRLCTSQLFVRSLRVAIFFCLPRSLVGNKQASAVSATPAVLIKVLIGSSFQVKLSSL